MTGASGRPLRVALLVVPLTVFLGVFFLWPLLLVVWESVGDTQVAAVLPRTKVASQGWDRTSPPSAAMQAAIVQDLLNPPDEQAVGEVTRRLNTAQPGFRSLMSKTLTRIKIGTAPGRLSTIDPRWDDPVYWRAIVDAFGPITDRNLLASVDLVHAIDGSITNVPEGTSANRQIIGTTLWIALLVTVVCIGLGVPYALLLRYSTGLVQRALMICVLLPLWTSLLVRTAAWFLVLQDHGTVNEILMAVGIIQQPLHLLFTRAGVIVAMAQVLLPFMVLPIYSTLTSIPDNLTSAAASLGARPLTSFFRVLLPLSLRGIVSGSLLVFMSAIGYYILPAIIGGAGEQMISSVVAFYALQSADWGMSGAFSLILLLFALCIYAVYVRLSTAPKAASE